MGRKKKYTTEKALRRGVEDYFKAITWQRPVMVETETGEVDKSGRAKIVLQMLRKGPDGTGKPVTATQWIEPPSLAGLCLWLGISKQTWSAYTHNEELKPATELARLRLEAYWQSRLEGKGAHGAKFVLINNFGWSGEWVDKVESTQRNVEMSVEEYLEQLEENGEEQTF